MGQGLTLGMWASSSTLLMSWLVEEGVGGREDVVGGRASKNAAKFAYHFCVSSFFI